MDKEAALEIYKQRYETFRHLDRLRWQLVQLTVAIFTATALVIRLTSGQIEWWFTLALAGALIGICFSMLKISSGLIANQSVLSEAASAVGDAGIPRVDQKMKSVFHWISFSVGIVGIIFFLKAILSFVGGLND